jgi:hypothetical protein
MFARNMLSWSRRSINTVIVASSWSSIFTLPTLMMHGQTQIKFRRLIHLCMKKCIGWCELNLVNQNARWNNTKMNFTDLNRNIIFNIRQLSLLFSNRSHYKIASFSEQNCTFLGYHHATSSDNVLMTFRDNLSVPSPGVFFFLTLEDSTDRLSRNVGNILPLLFA